ncbi:MAG: hypothetical protein SFU98_15970 [Leptospiraceae bacterium]|nr:hypothetical protein [Leptospiraceae bacterium]
MAYALRNVIAHNYTGISIKRMNITITEKIPELKIIINNILSELQ